MGLSMMGFIEEPFTARWRKQNGSKVITLKTECSIKVMARTQASVQHCRVEGSNKKGPRKNNNKHLLKIPQPSVQQQQYINEDDLINNDIEFISESLPSRKEAVLPITVLQFKMLNK